MKLSLLSVKWNVTICLRKVGLNQSVYNCPESNCRAIMLSMFMLKLIFVTVC